MVFIQYEIVKCLYPCIRGKLFLLILQIKKKKKTYATFNLILKTNKSFNQAARLENNTEVVLYAINVDSNFVV